jgi:hypothetical protein
LTEIENPLIMRLAGETDAGSAQVQPARDSRTKATNGRGGGSLYICHPIWGVQQTIQSFLMPLKTSCRRQA